MLAFVEGDGVGIESVVSRKRHRSHPGSVYQCSRGSHDAVRLPIYIAKAHRGRFDRLSFHLEQTCISPHVLRHTCALTVLQATKDLRKVSLWLGHASM